MLTARSFVGTESRLLTLFELLKQMSEGSEADPAKRVVELQKRRDEIDAEIARVLDGEVALLDDTALKDRFQQFQQLARPLYTPRRCRRATPMWMPPHSIRKKPPQGRLSCCVCP